MRFFLRNQKTYVKKNLMTSRSITLNKTWNWFHWKPNICNAFVTCGSLLLPSPFINRLFISFFQHWAHYWHNILSLLMGISALKPFSRNMGNLRRNRRKPVEKSRKNVLMNLKTTLTRISFILNFNFIRNINLSQKCVFESIVNVSRYWQT